MEKLVEIIWIVLALASLVESFWCPLVPKIIGWVFGATNIPVAIGLIKEGIKRNKEE